MAAAYLFCGRVCSGKTSFAQRLAREKNALILNCDEIMTLFPPLEGDETYARVSAGVKALLYRKALEATRCGADVILDWGFWHKKERRAAEAFFTSHGVQVYWYYFDPSDAAWERNIAHRNAHPGPADYFVDDGLRRKCLLSFEPPDEEEAETWCIVRDQGAAEAP